MRMIVHFRSRARHFQLSHEGEGALHDTCRSAEILAANSNSNMATAMAFFNVTKAYAEHVPVSKTRKPLGAKAFEAKARPKDLTPQVRSATQKAPSTPSRAPCHGHYVYSALRHIKAWPLQGVVPAAALAQWHPWQAMDTNRVTITDRQEHRECCIAAGPGQHHLAAGRRSPNVPTAGVRAI
jgi:hypothetical protein